MGLKLTLSRLVLQYSRRLRASVANPIFALNHQPSTINRLRGFTPPPSLALNLQPSTKNVSTPRAPSVISPFARALGLVHALRLFENKTIDQDEEAAHDQNQQRNG